MSCLLHALPRHPPSPECSVNVPGVNVSDPHNLLLHFMSPCLNSRADCTCVSVTVAVLGARGLDREMVYMISLVWFPASSFFHGW